MTKFQYYLVTEDGDVLGTNDSEVARVAGEDGTTLVINTLTQESTFDGLKTPVVAANQADWQDPDETDDEDEDEEDEA